MRVGSGGPPPTPAPDPSASVAAATGQVNGPSACARDGAEVKLAFGAGSEDFAFLWDTDHYVVAYANPATGAGDIYVALMAPDGTVMGTPAPIEATPAASDLPSLVKTSAGYLAVWEEGTAGKSVYAHALGPDASPVGSGLTIAATQAAQSRPVLAPAPGGQIAVSWMDTFDGKGGIQVAMVDPASLDVTAGPERVAEGDIDGWPSLSGDGSTLGVVWSDKGSGPYDIDFATIDPQSLALGQSTPLPGHGNDDQLLSRMIRTDKGYLAAWEDTTDSDNNIRMAAVDASGALIGGAQVEEPNTGDANWPNVAWTGTDAGIVYYQWRANRPQIFISFVDDTAARVAGLHDLQVSNGTTGWSKYPDVAWTGSEFGVLYADTRDGGDPSLWFQRVTCGLPTDGGVGSAASAPDSSPAQ